MNDEPVAPADADAALAADDLAGRLSRLYLGVVSDALDALGDRDHFLGEGIRPLDPSVKVVGPAYPVLGEPSTLDQYQDDATRLLGMFESLPAGAVLVYQTRDDGKGAAHFGELSANAIRHRGVRGIVLDGNVRDSQFLLEERFPVFCRGFSPLDGYGRWHIVEWDVPVEINGVRVRPGDYIYGDRDGVVRIPRDLVSQIIDTAERDAGVEVTIRAAVRRGQSPTALFQEHGRF